MHDIVVLVVLPWNVRGFSSYSMHASNAREVADLGQPPQWMPHDQYQLPPPSPASPASRPYSPLLHPEIGGLLARTAGIVSVPPVLG